MVGGYIPNCWAALRRAQESLQLKRSLVTPREFDFVDTALIRINQQLFLRRRDLYARGDKYREKHEPAVEAFSRETHKVQQTRDRLATLRYEKVTAANVYGLLSEDAEALADSLLRWQAHAENTRAEQLAMAPAAIVSDQEFMASLSGYTPGAPYTFDIDSMN
ncbi:hypothetical protein ALQ18_00414 [Pseudomonas marginalis pv. marginalis]|nr:hypothetical protein ALQ18_00414 [Pseudomonas marginalis pv. marginalis]